jgi:hypothetical protein
MPLPFIIGGIALAAGAYGVKKGVDAKDDFDTAERYNKKAEKIYNEAKEQLETERELTNSHLETLGELKVSIYEGSLADFVDISSKIKNIDFEDNLNLGLLNNVDEQDMLDIKSTVLEMQEVLGGGIAALGSGALAGFGALGGVGMLASASTGTAIASLSGAAATNATLAWLGGGSLAAGGLGMTGGIAVLGGIVAGPVLAVGGMMLASKAEEAKYAAYENLDKAKAAAEEMDAACAVLDGIYKRVDEFIEILEPLNDIFEDYIDILENIVDKSNDYRDYTQAEKEKVMATASIAITVKNICDAPIIDENGKVTRKSKKVLTKAIELTQKLREI